MTHRKKGPDLSELLEHLQSEPPQDGEVTHGLQSVADAALEGKDVVGALLRCSANNCGPENNCEDVDLLAISVIGAVQETLGVAWKIPKKEGH